MRNSKFSTERVSIKSHGLVLEGQLALAKPSKSTAVLFIRGGSLNFPATLTFARWQAHLARHGYSSLFFDFPGSGGWTQGKLEDNSLKQRLMWSRDCLRALIRHSGCEQLALVGSSMGAHQAVMQAGQEDGVAGLIISAGAMYNDDAVDKPFGPTLNKVLHEATDYTHNTMSLTLKKLQIPCLVFYGQNDQVIPEPIKTAYKDAAGPDNFYIVKGISHSYLHEPGEAAELARHLVFTKSVEFLDSFE